MGLNPVAPATPILPISSQTVTCTVRPAGVYCISL